MDQQIEELNKVLKGYDTPSIYGSISSTRRPAIPTGNFEIKHAIIQKIQKTDQFEVLSQENPNVHIANFLEIYYSFKQNVVTDDINRFFPFSLRDKAKSWLDSPLSSIITTWEELAKKFLRKYFHVTKY